MRFQVAPSSLLRSTPCPAVATSIVPSISALFFVDRLSQEDAAGQAAVDAERFAGDPARPWSGEEADRVRDLRGGQDPANRGAGDEVALDLLRGDPFSRRVLRVKLVDVLGLHDPGMQRVDGDAVRT